MTGYTCLRICSGVEVVFSTAKQDTAKDYPT